MIKKVVISKAAERDLQIVPDYIALKFMSWVEFVEHKGVEAARKIRGFHDEALQGRRWGQRSLRLSRTYRAIYRVVKGEIEFLLVEEVNKHDY